MKEQSGKMVLLGSAPIAKALLAMGVPTMIGMMINALYNLVDAYFVGGLGTSQMGAISVAFPLSQVVVGLGLLFGSGAASYISRLLGLGKKEQANQVASTALYGSLLVGGVVIIGVMSFLTPLLKMLGATPSILPYALSYTRIYILASIFNVFNVTMNSIVTSEGAAKTTMLALLAGAICNIILDPILIYTFNMGVAGAALATAIAQVLSTGIYLRYISSKKSVFHFRMKDCHFSKEILSEILKIGIPTLVFQVLTSLSISLINLQARGYGDSVIAGMGAVTRVTSLGSLMVFGFIKGFQPLAGYSYGARKFERLQAAIRLSVIWSTVFCGLFGLLLVLFPTEIISQFTRGDAELIRTGQTALRASGLTFTLFGFYTVYSSLFLALGKAKAGFFLGACRQGVCFVPVIFLLPIFWPLKGILYAQPIADLLSVAVTVLMALRLQKELSEKQQTLAVVSESPDSL
ncbi:MATE family efflux transporter [Enterococcus malodoratus]|uniref:MATE family efflux transporter n=1 Tax=Enterococcus malodoratus TaxID=71451 RepID=UPI002073AD85|nr:MATE family efflux transporter [Enterococcus malodoratus]